MHRLPRRSAGLALLLAAIVTVSCVSADAAAAPDTEPPSTDAQGWQGALWYTTPVTVTFIATDGPGGAGVAYTEYIVDPPATPALTDTGTQGTTVTISTDGKHRVWYRSVDLAEPANLESWEWVPVWIDSTLVPGSITGTVRNAQGVGIPGVEVLLYGLGAPQYSGWTDGSGSYVFAGLPPGVFKVKFSGALAGDYLSFYYHGHVELAGFGGYDNRSHADPVTVVAGLTTPSIDEVLLAPGHVTGTVRDGSGAGLNHVEVHAWVKLDGSWWEQWWTISEAGGTYDLGNLPTAVYRVQFVDPGGAYPTVWYGGADAVDAAADVVVTAGQTTTGIHSTLGEEPPPSDTTPPKTSASGADALWHRSAVSVTFSATDDPGGSGMSGGVAKTQYKIDGGSWTSGTRCVVTAPLNHSRDGRHTVTYRSTDAAGNTEAAKGVTVKIDTLGPVTAARAASGRRARAIALRYRVTDRLSPGATAIRIVVKNRRNVTVKTLRPTAKNTGVWYTVRWTPKATGTYRYYVHAKDLAGNSQSSVGSAKVVVR